MIATMKKNFDRYVRRAGRGVWAGDARFLHKGSHRQWRGVLNDEVFAAYDSMMCEQLSRENIAWLQQGSD